QFIFLYIFPPTNATRFGSHGSCAVPSSHLDTSASIDATGSMMFERESPSRNSSGIQSNGMSALFIPEPKGPEKCPLEFTCKMRYSGKSSADLYPLNSLSTHALNSMLPRRAAKTLHFRNRLARSV